MKTQERFRNIQCQLVLRLHLLLGFRIRIGIYSGPIINMHYLGRNLKKKLKTWDNMLVKLFTPISFKCLFLKRSEFWVSCKNWLTTLKRTSRRKKCIRNKLLKIQSSIWKKLTIRFTLKISNIYPESWFQWRVLRSSKSWDKAQDLLYIFHRATKITERAQI